MEESFRLNMDYFGMEINRRIRHDGESQQREVQRHEERAGGMVPLPFFALLPLLPLLSGAMILPRFRVAERETGT